jgi:RecG-like helicase
MARIFAVTHSANELMSLKGTGFHVISGAFTNEQNAETLRKFNDGFLDKLAASVAFARHGFKLPEDTLLFVSEATRHTIPDADMMQIRARIARGRG